MNGLSFLPSMSLNINLYIYTHTHIHIYIHTHPRVYVCECVCIFEDFISLFVFLLIWGEKCTFKSTEEKMQALAY